MAFARHRSAFRDVVKEGLLKACRVKVSMPCLQVSFRREAGLCTTCLFRKDGFCIGGVAAINLDLFEQGIPFCFCYYAEHASSR